MAIDSSIWIYQFQATMRDKDGRVLVNAHLVGFLRRICKLLFYGIKPVFVFDGGAPALKRMTIVRSLSCVLNIMSDTVEPERAKEEKERSSRESYANCRATARRADEEAGCYSCPVVRVLKLKSSWTLSLVSSSSGSKGKGKAFDGPVTFDGDTVYLEDLTNPSDVMSKSPSKTTPVKPKTPQKTPGEEKPNKWRDYDPYRLPDIDLDAAISKATRSSAPDPRLATEDELRTFIDLLRPEDLDVSSPSFRELPTEVQYEIIGDLRLKSRQTSHKRLETMLRSSKSALDFSKAQIGNLKQRNTLTQQLLTTTDSMGKAHVNIPVRIASERNREYMLVKNEGKEGGWILGIRDEGTMEKPIEIDQDDVNEDEDEDDDMEEVTMYVCALFRSSSHFTCNHLQTFYANSRSRSTRLSKRASTHRSHQASRRGKVTRGT